MIADVIVGIYLVGFVTLAGATFAFTWRMTGSLLKDMTKPPKKKVIPAPHPEMEGVKYGEELLVFKKPEDSEQQDDYQI
tara:strand:+ start:213 stop:449 length:237 start_codon:yes stop_codon:yes gene_type:complete